MSELFSLRQLAELVDGECLEPTGLNEPITFEGICLDSREFRRGQLFIARKGESTDGHRFIPDLISKGANCFLVDRAYLETFSRVQREELLAKTGFVCCDDSTKALGKFARAWREKLDIPVLLITGSNGKTSTKEYCRFLFERIFGPGHANLKSYNNHVGLPFSILSTPVEAKWLVLEAGMNHPGELKELASIASPDIGVILNVGLAHLEAFGKIENIADAKCEIIAAIRDGGGLLLPRYDQVLAEGVNRAVSGRSAKLKTYFFEDIWNSLERRKNLAVEPQTNCFNFKTFAKTKFGEVKFSIESPFAGLSAEIEFKVLGLHNASNALCALSLAELIISSGQAVPQPGFEDFAKRAKLLEELSSEMPGGASMRLQKELIGNTLIINDAYNANPTSMLSAIQTSAELGQANGAILVLGDMLELGERSKDLHQEVTSGLDAKVFKHVFCLGEFAPDLAAGAQMAGVSCSIVANQSQFAEQLAALQEKAGVWTFKASRKVGLENYLPIVRTYLEERKNKGAIN